MSNILQFPIQDSYDKYQASHVRQLARELGLDPKQAERDFLASTDRQKLRTDMAECARLIRMDIGAAK